MRDVNDDIKEFFEKELGEDTLEEALYVVLSRKPSGETVATVGATNSIQNSVRKQMLEFAAQQFPITEVFDNE